MTTPREITVSLNPGSPEAQLNGCTCPVLDNHYGAGHGGDGERWGWWVDGDCPVHGEGAGATVVRLGET